MGLLIDPNADNSKTFAKKLHKHCGKISAICYVGGIFWLLLLCDVEYNKPHTSLTDTSLMPGMVNRNFQDEQKANDYLNNFKKKESTSSQLFPSDFIEAFRKAGLHEIEEQNFTMYDPITKTSSQGTNVIGIMRGRRSAGAESMVLNVPYFSSNGKGRKNTAAIALVMALVEYFSEQTYWAKDIVFLVADGHLGSNAWIKGHHEIDSGKYLKVERVRNKAGHIQIAVNFVVEGAKVCSLSAKFHGINGQIPNLDMVNVVNKFVVSPEQKISNWEADIWKLADFVSTQATGTPTGSHGFFLQHGIQAVTMFGHRDRCKQAVQPQVLGKYLEGIFRSFNSIVERLHQSFFFWFLTTPNRVITISLYFPPLALILAPILLKPASIWLINDDLEITNSIALTTGIHCLALASRWLLSNLDMISDTFLMTPESFSQTFIILEAILLTTTLTILRRSSVLDNQSLISSLYCVATLQVATSLYCFALFNPSFALVMGLAASPIFSLLFFLEPVKRSRVFYVVLSFVVGVVSYSYKLLIPFIVKYFYESEMYSNLSFDFVTLSLLPALFTLLSIL